MQSMEINAGDTLRPACFLIKLPDGTPVSLSGSTVKVFMTDNTGPPGATVIAETTTGVTAEPTQTFTAATTDLLTCNDHGVKEGNQIVVATSGTLPTGLAAATRYFPIEISPNSFKVALTPSGPPIDITGTGSGTHTFYIVGSATYDWQAADVATAGTYWLWFVRVIGGEKESVPNGGRQMRIDIKTRA